MPRRDDEFYVGYQAESPPGFASRTRLAVILIVVLGTAIGLLLVTAQDRFDDGVFEFGVETQFDGIVVEKPYPLLLARDPSGVENRLTVQYLVGFGKRGAGDLVAGLDQQPVRITGSAIYNEHGRMIEAHSVERLSGADADAVRALRAGSERSMGSMTLVGEIVDSKCHFGVMKPGRGKPHKACAIRCISGGVPPLLRVEDRAGSVEYFLLVAEDGRSVNRDVLDKIAEPLEITGRVIRSVNLNILFADPSTYRRLGAHEDPPTEES